MVTNELNTESKILKVASDVFLMYGYHGTTINKIAIQAGVQKSVIHYYFRSKERLYIRVVENTLEYFIKNRLQLLSKSEDAEKYNWFLFTELYNNKDLFQRIIKELYPHEWVSRINEINKFLGKSI